VEIVVAEHEFLVRDGDDLHMQLNVPMTGAALGAALKVLTLDGERDVEIKAGTQSGAMLPLKGLGMTRLRGGTRGNLFVHIQVEIPTKLTKPEEELLRSFASMRGESTGQVRKNSDSGLLGKFRGAFKA